MLITSSTQHTHGNFIIATQKSQSLSCLPPDLLLAWISFTMACYHSECTKLDSWRASGRWMWDARSVSECRKLDARRVQNARSWMHTGCRNYGGGCTLQFRMHEVGCRMLDRDVGWKLGCLMQLIKNYEVGCTECYRGVEGRNSGTSRYLNLVQNSGPLVMRVHQARETQKKHI